MTTVNPIQTTTYDLTTGNNPITFGAATDINASGSASAVYGGGAANWTVTNHGQLAGYHGIDLSTTSTVTNTGSITGSNSAVYLELGGTVTNQATGVIDGEKGGVYITAAVGKVTNAGTISGATYYAGHTLQTRGFSVALTDGGSVTNQSGGMIDAYLGGVYITGGNGTVTNLAGGTIEASAQTSSGNGAFGVAMVGDSGTVTNAGVIAALGTASTTGVILGGVGGKVVNERGGLISGHSIGVNASFATVINAGVISAAGDGTVIGDAGVLLDGGQLTNEAGGWISGGYWGVQTADGGNVTNAGTIVGTTIGPNGGGVGVFLRNGGKLTNQAGGLITGAADGVYLGATGSVIDAGTISGGVASVQFGGGGKNVLTLETDSALGSDAFGSTASGATTALILTGQGTAGNAFIDFNTLAVTASGGAWVLDGMSAIAKTTLTSGDLEIGDLAHPGAELTSILTIKAAATLSGDGAVAGSKITNAGLIEAVDNGGALTIDNAVANTGNLEAAGGVLDIMGAVSGAGTAVIASGTLALGSTFTESVTFTGATGVLDLAHSRTYSGTVTGFAQSGGTSFDLRDIGFDSPGEATYSGTTSGGILTVSDGRHTATINLAGDYTGSTWVASSDGGGGVIVVDSTADLATSAPHAFVAAMASMGAGQAAVSSPASHDWWAAPPMLNAPRTQMA